MRRHELERQIIHTRMAEAYEAYCRGHEPGAVKLYGQAVEMAERLGDRALEQLARRWHGNSLMWSGQHEAAFRVLSLAAAYDEPDAEPASAYGAKTDRLLLSLSHASAAFCRELLRDARGYLDRVAKPQWAHRLDMLEGILCFRQGNPARALVWGQRALRSADQAVGDGPAYTRPTYLKWIIRPGFFARQPELLAFWVAEMATQPVLMVSDRIRQHCAQLLLLRTRRADGAEVAAALREEALNCAAVASGINGVWDEIHELGRALMLAGEWAALDRLPLEKMRALPFENALFAADREVNRLRQQLGLPPWDGDLDWPRATPPKPGLPAGLSLEPEKIRTVLHELDKAAAREDERMETQACSQAARRRVEHLKTLLPRMNFSPVPNRPGTT